MPNQSANSSLRLIQAYARRGMAHWYIPLEIRADAHEMLLRATGAEVRMIRHLPTVLVDGVAALDDRQDIRRAAVAPTLERIAAWCRTPDDVPDSLMPPTIPSGTSAIMSSVGLSVRNVLAITRVLHHFRCDEGSRRIETVDNHSGRTMRYDNGGQVSWRNGIVKVRRAALPANLAAALTGLPVNQVVDDPAFAGMTVRMVPSTPRRDHVLQIITTDAGRHVRP